MSDNYLTGQLPVELPEDLWLLAAGSNALSGALPEEWSGLTSLTRVALHGNRLFAEEPLEVNLPHANFVDLSANVFGRGMHADGVVRVAQTALLDTSNAGCIRTFTPASIVWQRDPCVDWRAAGATLVVGLVLAGVGLSTRRMRAEGNRPLMRSATRILHWVLVALTGALELTLDAQIMAFAAPPEACYVLNSVFLPALDAPLLAGENSSFALYMADLRERLSQDIWDGVLPAPRAAHVLSDTQAAFLEQCTNVVGCVFRHADLECVGVSRSGWVMASGLCLALWLCVEGVKATVVLECARTGQLSPRWGHVCAVSMSLPLLAARPGLLAAALSHVPSPPVPATRELWLDCALLHGTHLALAVAFATVCGDVRGWHILLLMLTGGLLLALFGTSNPESFGHRQAYAQLPQEHALMSLNQLPAQQSLVNGVEPPSVSV